MFWAGEGGLRVPGGGICGKDDPRDVVRRIRRC